jgi:hypothetical protein
MSIYPPQVRQLTAITVFALQGFYKTKTPTAITALGQNNRQIFSLPIKRPYLRELTAIAQTALGS